MDTSAALIAATLAPPALFGMAMLLDQLEERRHRRHMEATRAAATPADQLEALRRARANHPTARKERNR